MVNLPFVEKMHLFNLLSSLKMHLFNLLSSLKMHLFNLLSSLKVHLFNLLLHQVIKIFARQSMVLHPWNLSFTLSSLHSNLGLQSPALQCIS
jgi:hypothetical protein